MGVEPLKKRADYLALRQAPAISTAAFKLVRSKRSETAKPEATDPALTSKKHQSPEIRVGFTVTKKIGNAVVRNRIRRRLKSAANLVFPLQGETNADYVVIAYKKALDRSFHDLIADMEKAGLALRAGKGKKRR